MFIIIFLHKVFQKGRLENSNCQLSFVLKCTRRMSFSMMEITIVENKAGVTYNGILFNSESASSRIWTKAKYENFAVKKVTSDVL